MIDSSPLRWLQLLQLADSAVPIGSAAHSYGLEMLAADGLTGDLQELSLFFADYLREVGAVEAAYCRAAHAALCDSVTSADAIQKWLDLNSRLDALKTAREARQASATLGRRFLQLVVQLETDNIVVMALEQAKRGQVAIHHCAAFGLVGAVFGLDASAVIGAYLHQSTASLISACQRLMPLGQGAASQLLWELKSEIVDITTRCIRDADLDGLDVPLSTPLLELASQRHQTLTTRLFIS